MTFLSWRWLIATSIYAVTAGLLAAIGSATDSDALWQAAYVLLLPVGYVVAMGATIYADSILGLIVPVGSDVGVIDFVAPFGIVAFGAVVNAFVAWAAWEMTRGLCQSCRARWRAGVAR